MFANVAGAAAESFLVFVPICIRMEHQRLTRNREKEIARLSQGKFRKADGQYLVEGVRLVESAFAGDATVVELVVTKDGAERIPDLLGRVPTFLVDQFGMDRMADVKTAQGVLAVVTLPESGERRPQFPMLVLDGVQDPGNVGALIRSAAWFGIAQIVTGPGTADPYSPKVVRASMGGLWDVEMVSVGDLPTFLKDIQNQGYPVSGADLEGKSVRNWNPPRDAVLVLGSEAHGLSPEVRGIIDTAVRIDGSDNRRAVESLNVGVAAGILLYHWSAVAGD